MQKFIIIGSVLATLAGWFITYEPFGLVLPENTYWYIYDIAKSVPLVLLALWPFYKVSGKWIYRAQILFIYFGLNLVGDIIGINEKGNWFTYITGAIFIHLIATILLPKCLSLQSLTRTVRHWRWFR